MAQYGSVAKGPVQDYYPEQGEKEPDMPFDIWAITIPLAIIVIIVFEPKLVSDFVSGFIEGLSGGG